MKNELNNITAIIAKLIIKRRTTPHEQQAPINKKLDKLYNIKRIMMAQIKGE